MNFYVDGVQFQRSLTPTRYGDKVNIYLGPSEDMENGEINKTIESLTPDIPYEMK
jgi:hypothetical protein